MPSSVTAHLASGVLHVFGTPAADLIVVNNARGRVVVAGVGQFAAQQVRRVEIDAGAGDDIVHVNVTRPRLIAVFDGGDGNDWLRGRRGPDVFRGGAGDDRIEGRGGADAIDPGAGRNVVNGRLVVVPSPPAPHAPAPAPSPTAPPASPPTTSPTWTLITPDPAPGIDAAAWVRRLYTLVNAERVKAGLNALTVNSTLERLAALQADQMVRYGKMQHEIPEAPYPDMRSRADAVGYKLAWLGENLAYNYGDPEAVVQGWMFSQGHRDNLLFAPFVEMGIAVALDASGRPYIALELGHPA